MGFDIEKFVCNTADYTLRECYKRLGNIELAENAFIEVYSDWYKNAFSKISLVRRLVLKYEIIKVCNRSYKE